MTGETFGKVVLVTGAATGIGRACVTRFRAAGWRVILGYYGAAEQALAEADASPDVVALPCDVSDDGQCRAIAEAARIRFGRLDALVNSAGTTRLIPHADLDALDAAEFHRLYAVNTIGPFQMVRACAPLLAEGEGGAVVIISSYGAILGTGSSIAYAASKGAVNTMTMSLARVLAPKVRINAVCPALVETDLIQRLDKAVYVARRDQQIERAPLRKVAQASEVAETIFFLAATDTLMTGEIVNLTCGVHLLGDA
jgi:3-oxoacyl-[acyl-carrier protein] reductase